MTPKMQPGSSHGGEHETTVIASCRKAAPTARREWRFPSLVSASNQEGSEYPRLPRAVRHGLSSWARLVSSYRSSSRACGGCRRTRVPFSSYREQTSRGFTSPLTRELCLRSRVCGSSYGTWTAAHFAPIPRIRFHRCNWMFRHGRRAQRWPIALTLPSHDR